MSFVFRWVKDKENKNKELDKIVKQAKQTIGKQIISKEGIPLETLQIIPIVIKQIDNYMKEHYTPLILIFLKAQLFHKKYQIKQSMSCYQKIIDNKSTIKNKVILAKTYIAMANITNQQSQTAKETDIEGEKHSPRNKAFTRYINDAIKLLPKKQIKKIMEQYYWLNQEQKKLADKMLREPKKKKDKITTLKVKPT
ncbi:MAG: hypothetical protein PVG30_08740 [Gammaproteobacteria bacterium]|jgi:hypothetical protein